MSISPSTGGCWFVSAILSSNTHAQVNIFAQAELLTLSLLTGCRSMFHTEDVNRCIYIYTHTHTYASFLSCHVDTHVNKELEKWQT